MRALRTPGATGPAQQWVETTVAGTRARLVGIYAEQKLFGQIDHVELTGRAGATTVTERVVP